MEIKRAEISDAQKIYELQQLAFLSEAELHGTTDIPPLKQTVEEIKKEFNSKVILKIEDGDKIVGSVRAKREGKTVYVGKLMVHPDYRKQGLGSSLLLEVEKIFPKLRYELFASLHSAGNIKLYKSLGYKPFKWDIASDVEDFIYLDKR